MLRLEPHATAKTDCDLDVGWNLQHHGRGLLEHPKGEQDVDTLSGASFLVDDIYVRGDAQARPAKALAWRAECPMQESVSKLQRYK